MTGHYIVFESAGNAALKTFDIPQLKPDEVLLEYVAWEGRISLLGCTRVSDVPIDFYKYVHRRGISLIGAHTFTRAQQESAPGRWTQFDDFRTFLKLLAAKKIQTKPLISEFVSPETAPAVYARLAETKNPPLGIVFDWSKIK